MVAVRAAARALALALAALVGWAAQAQPVAESTVKAAFLYKFLGYVEWPAAAVPPHGSPYVIGVLGDEAVASELERLLPGHAIDGHPVMSKRLRAGDSLHGLSELFVGRQAEHPAATIRMAEQRGVLVVSDSIAAFEAGSAVNLVTADERVGFEVSLPGARRAGLRISSRMLSVARRVVGRT